jgi:hypothetical protein
MFGALNMFGGTITETCTVTATTMSFANTNVCPTLAQFNGPGTLMGVTLQLTSTSGVVYAEFFSSETTSQAFNSATGSDSFSFTVGPDTAGGAMTSATCAGSVPAIPPSPQNSGSTCPNTPNAFTSGVISATSLTAYIGSGFVSVSDTGQLGLAGGNAPGGTSGLFSFGSGGTVGGTLQLVFTYNSPAPEPTTLLLMGCGLVGLGLASKKRMRRG